MPRSRVDIGPGQASAYQSPFAIGGFDAMGGGGGFGALLARQMALREQMTRMRMQGMRQQMGQAREQFQWQKNQRRGGPVGGFGTPAGGNLKERMIGWAAQMRPRAIGPEQQFFSAQDAMAKAAAAGGPGGGGAGWGAYTPPTPSPGLARGRLRAGGYSFEEGGKVPKTGTYKLHKGEVVVKKSDADVMFPYALRGPEQSSGKARKSYQEGTMWGGMGGVPGEPTREQPGWAQAFNEWLSARQATAPGGFQEELAPPTAGGAMPGAGGGPEGAEPYRMGLALSEAMAPVVTPPTVEEKAPWEETTGEGGERKFTIEGKPEGESERKQRWRDEIRKYEESAKYHESRRDLLMSYFSGQPEKLSDPTVKNLLSQRDFLASKFQGYADKRTQQLEKIEEAEKQQETLKEIKKIETGGRQALAQSQHMQKVTELYQKQFADTTQAVDKIQTEFADNADKRLYHDRMYNAYSGYVPMLAHQWGMTVEQAQEYLGVLIGGSLDDPQNLVMLNTFIQGAIGI